MALVQAHSRIEFERIGIWFLLAAVFALALIGIPAFRDPANLANVLRQSSVLGMIAIGQTFVIAAGMIDLSVGMIAGLVVVLSCWLLEGSVALTAPVAVLMLATGAAIGFVNGTLVNRLKLDPLIGTFGMLSVLQGLIFTFTDRSVGRASPPLQALANGDFLGFPLAAAALGVIAFTAHIVFARTRFGYHLLAAGGSPDGARRAGIAVGAIRLRCFVICGTCAALGGLLLAGRLGTGYPLAGAGLELDAIVAVVLGGTALAGGRGSVMRSIGGVLALAIISNSLNLLEVSAFVQTFIKGTVVILAILVNRPRAERR